MRDSKAEKGAESGNVIKMKATDPQHIWGQKQSLGLNETRFAISPSQPTLTAADSSAVSQLPQHKFEGVLRGYMCGNLILFL